MLLLEAITNIIPLTTLKRCVNVCASFVSSIIILSFYKTSLNSIGITSKFNAISSLTFAGCAVDGPVLIRLSLMVLSIASFCLWSESTMINNVIDVSSIYWVIINVTLHLVSKFNRNNSIIYILNGSAVLFIIFLITSNKSTKKCLDFYQNNLVPLTAVIYIYSGLILCSFYSRDKIFLKGIGVISGGFVLKLLSIYNQFYIGTGLFHILTAYGVDVLLLLYKPTTAAGVILLEMEKNPINEVNMLREHNCL